VTTPTLTPLVRRGTELARRLWHTPATRAVVARVRPPLLRVRKTWRRSLQVRMVVITVICTGLLVGVFGYLMAKRTNDALLEGARSDAYVRMERGSTYLTQQLQTLSNGEDPDTDNSVKSFLATLANSPEQGGDVTVAVKFSKAVRGSNLRPVVSYPDDRVDEVKQAITPQLEHQVADLQMIAHQVVTVNGNTYLVYGKPVYTRWTYGQVELYYVVSLSTEVGSAETIRTTISIVGGALLLLLTILVVLVTRLVAQPVRLAAQTAQRLSAGLLDQRMDVKGEDELAMLAEAFNHMAENLQRQIVRLEEMSRLQRRFTSDVSHELRTPLTTVRMAADLLHSERDNFDPAVARSAELLQAELDRFEELLTDLLEISRFDAGFAMLDGEPTDLVSLVRRVADRLTSVAKRCGVELSVITPEPPVIAEVDARRVERVVRNLVDNAIDHGLGKPVVISLAADANAAAITVRDHGVGLKPGEEKHVFNRFWRADPSRARQTGGTGLGLSISYEDARLHGGWLEAWGELGKGAQFRLTIPIRAGARLSGSPLPLQPVDTLDIPVLPSQPTPTEVPA
jgi:two-component system sensor histidine kinase MtrB